MTHAATATIETAAPSASTENRSFIMTVRERPVSLKFEFGSWSAHAAEVGYFPISETGYRSLISELRDAGNLPTAELLEKLAGAFDAERVKSLVTARALLARRFVPADDTIGDVISISMAAESATLKGFFAPADERIALWEAAYLLFDRLARDPLLYPRGTPRIQGAWNPASCARHAKASARSRDILGKLMSGDFSKFDSDGLNFGFGIISRAIDEFGGPPFPAQSLPILDLVVFPSPLRKEEKHDEGQGFDDVSESDDDGDADGSADDLLESKEPGTADHPEVKPTATQLDLF